MLGGWVLPSWGDRGWWSPDGSKLAVKRRDTRNAGKVPIVHWLKQTEDVTWEYYPPAGGPVRQIELFVLDVLSRQRVRVDI